jgi:hypothetical protein
MTLHALLFFLIAIGCAVFAFVMQPLFYIPTVICLVIAVYYMHQEYDQDEY